MNKKSRPFGRLPIKGGGENYFIRTIFFDVEKLSVAMV